MKILFAGNSQASCVKMAHDSDSQTLAAHDVHFYVTPGGEGPYFTTDANRLRVIWEATNPKFPPRFSPPETQNQALDHYDAIVISALGYIDGGFCYINPVLSQGVLHAYGPKPNEITNRYLSESCYRKVIGALLNQQYGFRFLRSLRSNFRRKIIVQPFPLMSEIVKDSADWALRRMYSDPVGAYAFFIRERNSYMKGICEELDADLLPYPDVIGRDSFFSPAKLIRMSDGLHPLESYGHMILEQVKQELDRPAN